MTAVGKERAVRVLIVATTRHCGALCLHLVEHDIGGFVCRLFRQPLRTGPPKGDADRLPECIAAEVSP